MKTILLALMSACIISSTTLLACPNESDESTVGVKALPIQLACSCDDNSSTTTSG